MSDRQCPVCGEDRFPGWTYCPACGHPYPDEEDEEDEEEDDVGALAWSGRLAGGEVGGSIGPVVGPGPPSGLTQRPRGVVASRRPGGPR